MQAYLVRFETVFNNNSNIIIIIIIITITITIIKTFLKVPLKGHFYKKYIYIKACLKRDY